MWDDFPLPEKSKYFFNRPYRHSDNEKIVKARYLDNLLCDERPAITIEVVLESGDTAQLVQYGTCVLKYELIDIENISFSDAQKFLFQKWKENNVKHQRASVYNG